MKAKEIMEELFSLAAFGDFSETCDTCKAGDPDKEVKKAAVSMFATVDVIRQAKNWGAELLITHEPTYYNHMDIHSDEKIESEKRKLINDTGLVIYRYHDYPHSASPDIISAGMLKGMNIKGKIEQTDVFDLLRIHLDSPLTPLEVARILEENLGILHIRVCGAADVPCTEISAMFGTPGGVFEELKNDKCQILLTGEACEWALGEYARDAAQLGHKKALLILGHIGSERDGMKYTAELLKDKHLELEVEYFECGEVYTYTDSAKTRG